MVSARSGHNRKADGRPKVAYATEADAAAANTDPSMAPYLCRHCGRWHLGHRPGTTFMTHRARQRSQPDR